MRKNSSSNAQAYGAHFDHAKAKGSLVPKNEKKQRMRGERVRGSERISGSFFAFQFEDIETLA